MGRRTYASVRHSVLVKHAGSVLRAVVTALVATMLCAVSVSCSTDTPVEASSTSTSLGVGQLIRRADEARVICEPIAGERLGLYQMWTAAFTATAVEEAKGDASPWDRGDPNREVAVCSLPPVGCRSGALVSAETTLIDVRSKLVVRAPMSGRMFNGHVRCL